MAARANVVLTGYVWDSLAVEKQILGDLADLVPMKTKSPDEFLGREGEKSGGLVVQYPR